MGESDHSFLTHSTPASPPKRHDRRYYLVFGSDGQATLVGSGTEPSVSYPVTVISGLPTQTPLPGYSGLHTSSQTSSAPTSIPRLAISSASPSSTLTSPVLTSTSGSFSPETTSAASGSTHSSTLSLTDTASHAPFTPTGVSASATPVPTPTSPSQSKGYGAPFYFAIVLGSFCAVACVAASIAWWIRSRPRKSQGRELEDPWGALADPDQQSESEWESTVIIQENTNVEDKEWSRGIDSNSYRKPRRLGPPIELPAFVVQRGTAGPVVYPPPTNERSLLYSVTNGGLASLVQGPYPHFLPSRRQDHSHSRRSLSIISSSQASSSRPHPERFPTETSVQESMRTLGRLRVANMMPGDVTSGDEGMTRDERDVRLTPTEEEDVGDNIVRSTSIGGPKNIGIAGYVGRGRYGRVSPERHHSVSVPVVGQSEPTRPATVPWGRRMSASSALRRTRASDVVGKTHANAAYDASSQQTLPSDSTLKSGRVRTGRYESNQTGPSLVDPQSWTQTFKSGIMHALDAVVGGHTQSDPTRSREREPHITSGHFSEEPLSRPTSVPASKDTWSSGPPESVLQYGRTRGKLQNPYGRSQGTLQLSNSQLSLLKPPGTVRIWQANSQSSIEASTGSSSSMPVSYAHSTNVAGRKANQTITPLGSTQASTMSVYSADTAATSATARIFGYVHGAGSQMGPSNKAGDVLHSQFRTRSHSPLRFESTIQQSKGNTAHFEAISVPSGHSTLQDQQSTPQNTALSRKKGVVTRRKRTPARPPPIRRVSSTASSILSFESSRFALSVNEAAARRALLERRRKAGVNGAVQRRETMLRSIK